MEIKLTVFFEDPFWIGMFEVRTNYDYSICKYVFGSEPKDNEIYEMILSQYNGLKFFKSYHNALPNTKKRINPKRMQRLIQKELDNSGISTKAQQAISAQRESNKLQTKKMSKQRKEELKKIKYGKRQGKKKQKKRGH